MIPSIRIARRDWVWPLLCCAILLAAVLLANPFDDAGFEDEWSYGHEALKLAQTGRFHHNGWGGSLLLFQSLWALPWIRLFGFSFQVLQISVIPLSLGSVLLIYAVGRQAGLSRQLAAFASMGATLCPLLLPFAASFMTESCACFFSLLCIWCALSTAQAESSRDAIRWLWALAAAGFVGGANRQIVWAAGLAPILWIAWERRGDPRFRWHAAASLAASVAAICATLHFFSPPYGALHPGGTSLTRVLLSRAHFAVAALLQLVLVAVFMAVPAFACAWPRLQWRAVGASAILTIPLAFAGGPMAPYGNNMVTVAGIAFGRQDLGGGFIVWPPLLCLVLTAVVNACVFALPTASPAAMRIASPAERSAYCIFGVFSIAYIALLIPGAVADMVYDRYMVPLVPLFFLAIVIYAARGKSHAPAAAWLCLVLMSGYAVAATHDHFAQLRASLLAAHSLEKAGVARNRISAGMEYDGWTQLGFSDYVPGIGFTDARTDPGAKEFWLDAWDHLPNVRPDYVVLNGSTPASRNGGFLSVGFHAWLPPFRRSVAMWERAQLTSEMRAARMISATSLRP